MSKYMNFVIGLLIIINVAFAIYAIIKTSYKKSFEINHIMLFFIGFLFYWITPIIVGTIKIFYEKKSMTFWFVIFENISKKYIVFYLINTLLFALAFYFGSIYYTKRKEENIVKIEKEEKLDFDLKYINIFYFIDMIAILLFMYKFRFAFFKGYSSDITLTLTKGTFVAVSLVMLMLSLIVVIKRKQMNPELTFLQTIKNKYTITYFIVAILILSLGGRLYFLSSVIMYMVIYTKYFNRIKLSTVVGIGISGLTFAGSIGLLRQSSFEFDLMDIILNILLEPLYTAYSTLAFLVAEINTFVELPIYFIRDFINLIPSFIAPNKLQYIIQPEVIYNPQGALSSYVSFMINFGIIGTSIVLFIFGYVLNYMKDNKNSVIIKCFYIAICGWIPFTFFRDEFFVSIIKNILEFSILIPLIMVIVAHMLTFNRYKDYYKRIRNLIKNR